MDIPTFENLDLACAKAGKTIAENPSKELENLVTSALAVLEEQGVYALFLFLSSKEEISLCKKKISLCKKMYELLKETPQQSPLLIDREDVWKSLQQMAEDLDKLLLARDLLRQTLIYARYHARVPKKSEVQI
jgi:hypothetical protein